MIIDLHTHILPYVDDGASSLEEALAMLENAVLCGVKKLALTPHANVPDGNDNYYDEELATKFRQFSSCVKEAEIDIELIPGMEVFATSEVSRLMKQKKFLTLNCTRYLLLEFGFNESVPFTFSLVDELVEMGCIPLIAHPERYPYVQENPNIVFEWIRMGACTQLNKGSVLGHFGIKAGEVAMQLLQNDLVSVVASDAHDTKRRTTSMADAFDYISGAFSDEYAQVLFCENPLRLLNDKELLSNGPMPI